MTKEHKVILISNKVSLLLFFLTAISTGFLSHKAQAGWLKRLKEVESFEDLVALKRESLNMAARQEISVKCQKKWRNRLQKIELFAQHKGYLGKLKEIETQEENLPQDEEKSALSSSALILKSPPQGQSVWLKKLNQGKSIEELITLHKHCLVMVAREQQRLKGKNKWCNRLKQLEAFAQDKGYLETLKVKEIEYQFLTQPDGRNILHYIFGVQASLQVQDFWLNNLKKVKSVESFLALKGQCLDHLTKENKKLKFKRRWLPRLEQLEKLAANKNNLRLLIERNISSKSNNPNPYKVRHIYINTKNPLHLDLHGIASAQLAQQRVIEFINAAKSKKRRRILIITGKGNHSTPKKQRGVLFNAFPKWVENNKHVESYEVGKGSGSYIVTLSPSAKLLRVGQSSRENQIKYLEQQIAFSKKHHKSNLPYMQMHKELIRLTHKVNELEKKQTMHENFYFLLSEVNAHSSLKEDITNSIETEDQYTPLKKARLENFLTPLQKVMLGLE